MAEAGDLWPWLTLAGLGAFHGLNPAMGWLFAVALGLHRGGRRTVLAALLPIALGHAAAVLAVVLLALAVGSVLDSGPAQRLGGLVLLGWALWHGLRGHRGRVRFGLTTSMAGLAAWSFLMATAHGAGLMLLPFLPAAVDHAHHAGPAASRLPPALASVAVHSLAMLATTAAVSVLVHDWIGLGVLRRGSVNVDLVWTAALLAAGLWLLL